MGLRENREADFDEESWKRSAKEAYQQPTSARANVAAGKKKYFLLLLIPLHPMDRTGMVRRQAVRGTCSECGEEFTICNDGQLKKHAPCGKVEAPLNDFRRHLLQYHAPRPVDQRNRNDDMDDEGGAVDNEEQEEDNRSRIENNKRKQISKANQKWANDGAKIIKEMDETVDQYEYIHGNSSGEPNKAFSELMQKLLAMTPPGKRKIEPIEEGQFDHNGMPLDFYEQRRGRGGRGGRKGPDNDQSKADRTLEYVNKCLFIDHNISKSISFLRSNGIMELAKPEAREALGAKFATERMDAPPDDELPEWMREMPAITDNPANKPIDYVKWDESRARSYIMGKKQGAGSDANGWSFNDVQTLIRIAPDILEPLCRVCSYLPFGILDNAAREIITVGRGTVLKKNKDPESVDVRPIVTKNPLLQLAAYMANNDGAEMVAQICGKSQLGGNKGGACEALIHLTRTLLQANPGWVMLKKDAKNAYGAIFNWAMVRMLGAGGRLTSSALGRLALFELRGSPTNVIFKDSKNSITVVHKLHEGVPQGGVDSGSIYTMTQSIATNDAFEGNNRVFHAEYMDDVFILGKPQDVMDADSKVDENLEVIGIYQNKSKREMFGYGGEEEYTQEDRERATAKGYKWKDDGVIVVGSPIGTPEYEKSKCMEKVREIEAQIEKLTKTVNLASTFKGHSSQWQYHVYRRLLQPQFAHIIRTVSPDNVTEAAEEFDKIIRDRFAVITGLKQRLTGATERERKRVEQQTTLPISRGGFGFSNMKAAARAAYVGSFALVAPLMTDTHPAIKSMENTPVLVKLEEIIAEMKVEGFISATESDSFKWANMCEKKQAKMQKTINDKIVAVAAADNKREATEGGQEPRAGVRSAGRPMTEQARVTTTNANGDSGASAWLNATPTIICNSMNNAAFNTSVRVRSMLGVFDDGSTSHDWRCNACNCAVGHDGAHTLCCQAMVLAGTSQGLRNPQHAQVVNGLAKLMMSLSSQTRYAVAPRASNLPHIFGQTVEGRNRANAAAATRRARGERPDRRHDQYYGDLILVDSTGQNRPDIVIDVTVASPNKTAAGHKGFDKPGKAADEAEKEKRAKWKAAGLTVTDSPRACMVVYAVDTTGAPGKSARKFIEHIGILVAEARGAESAVTDTKRIIEGMSVVTMTALADTIFKAKSLVHSVAPRTTPQRNAIAPTQARGAGIRRQTRRSSNLFNTLADEDSDGEEESNNNREEQKEDNENEGENRERDEEEQSDEGATPAQVAGTRHRRITEERSIGEIAAQGENRPMETSESQQESRRTQQTQSRKQIRQQRHQRGNSTREKVTNPSSDDYSDNNSSRSGRSGREHENYQTRNLPKVSGNSNRSSTNNSSSSGSSSSSSESSRRSSSRNSGSSSRGGEARPIDAEKTKLLKQFFGSNETRATSSGQQPRGDADEIEESEEGTSINSTPDQTGEEAVEEGSDKEQQSTTSLSLSNDTIAETTMSDESSTIIAEESDSVATQRQQQDKKRKTREELVAIEDEEGSDNEETASKKKKQQPTEKTLKQKTPPARQRSPLDQKQQKKIQKAIENTKQARNEDINKRREAELQQKQEEETQPQEDEYEIRTQRQNSESDGRKEPEDKNKIQEKAKNKIKIRSRSRGEETPAATVELEKSTGKRRGTSSSGGLDSFMNTLFSSNSNNQNNNNQNKKTRQSQSEEQGSPRSLNFEGSDQWAADEHETREDARLANVEKWRQIQKQTDEYNAEMRRRVTPEVAASPGGFLQQYFNGVLRYGYIPAQPSRGIPKPPERGFYR